jgi:flagellar hook assembly protein FlgD
VRTLVAEDLYQAGRHQVWWNGRDEAGRTVGAGVYLVRLQGGGRSEAESMVLLK